MAKTVYEKLRRHLDVMPVGFPESDSGIELRVLEHLFTPEEAAVAFHVSAVAEPVERIRRRMGGKAMSAEALSEILDRMVAKGSIREERKRIKGRRVRFYGKLPFAIGMYEMQLDRLTPEFERDAHAYMDEAFIDDFLASRPRQLRTIPVNASVKNPKTVGTYENVRSIVERSKGPFVVHNCVCRQGREILGHECTTTSLNETCISLEEGAAAFIGSGKGTRLSRQELLDFLLQAEKEGLVIQPQNTKDPKFICCCCKCCCAVLTNARKLPNPGELLQASHFAAVDAAVCTGCGKCVKVCPMDAVMLGKDGKPVVARVDTNRCIGCGLCAAACPVEAISLERCRDAEIPPDNGGKLYMKMLINRFGPFRSAYLGLKALLGLKI